MARSKPSQDLSSSMLAGSEELFDLFCQPCSPDKHVEAVGYCQECSEYLCITCTDCHGKLSATKHHKVLGKSEMPKIRPTTKTQHTDLLTEKCRKHPDEVLKYFCKTHDEICCSVCITLDHISCANKNYVPDISSGIAQSQEYRDLMTDLDRLLRQITKLQGDSSDSSKSNEKYHSDALANIKELRIQVNDLLDQLEEDTKRQLANMHQVNTDLIRRMSETCQTLLSEVKAMTVDMDATAKAGKNNQLFVQIKLSRHCTTGIEKRMEEEENECRIIQYEFNKDEKIQQLISTLSNIWSLSMKRDTTSTKARYMREINMKSEEDTYECYIDGIAVLSKDRIAIADFHNRAVKLYDMKANKLLYRIPVTSGSPCEITKMKSDQVAVTLGTGQKIVIVKFADALTSPLILRTPGANVFALCYHRSNFITACQDPACVKIIDMSGKTLHTFSTDDKGCQLFAVPRCISLGRGKNVVYITDRQTHKVTSMTLSGRVNWVYSNDKLRSPRGVAVDKDGAVYVGSRENHTIHQLSAAGNLKQIILESDKHLTLPHAIAYGEEEDMLYISNVSRKSEDFNYIRLFHLE